MTRTPPVGLLSAVVALTRHLLINVAPSPGLPLISVSGANAIFNLLWMASARAPQRCSPQSSGSLANQPGSTQPARQIGSLTMERAMSQPKAEKIADRILRRLRPLLVGELDAELDAEDGGEPTADELSAEDEARLDAWVVRQRQRMRDRGQQQAPSNRQPSPSHGRKAS